MFQTPRSKLILLTGTLATALVLPACSASDPLFGPNHRSATLADGPQPAPAPTFGGEHTDFVTRPDLKDLPTTHTKGEAYYSRQDGLISLSPTHQEAPPEQQPLANAIIDSQGDAVWLQNRDHLDPEHDSVYNLQFQEYQGEPVLTWWEGITFFGVGFGEVVVADTSYNEVMRITPTEGNVTVEPDLHEHRITDDDTMLTVYYQPTQTDMTAVGGPEDGWVYEGVVHEYDLATGELLFDWHSLEHVPVEASRWNFTVENERDPGVGTREQPFDYFHINSANVDADNPDALLVSARNTHAVYSIDRQTGDVNFTLGGILSDYEMVGESYFNWQHDVQRAADGTLRILDNASEPVERHSSRVLYLELDDENSVATVAREMEPPEPRLAFYMANAETAGDTNVLAGWGHQPSLTQFNRRGNVTFDIVHEPYTSYRAYLSDTWHGSPEEAPALVVQDGQAHVSWNVATEVAQWRVLTGEDAENASFHKLADRDGFETAVPVEQAPFVAVQALDEDANVLAASYVES